MTPSHIFLDIDRTAAKMKIIIIIICNDDSNNDEVGKSVSRRGRSWEESRAWKSNNNATNANDFLSPINDVFPHCHHDAALLFICAPLKSTICGMR